jgi:hypothetical protein
MAFSIPSVVVALIRAGGMACPPPPGDFNSTLRYLLVRTINFAGERIYYDRATVFAQLGVFREPIGWVGQVGLVLNIR